MVGVILAAGASSRLGEAKQLLVYQGQSLLERSIRLAFSVCQDVLVCLGSEVVQSVQIVENLKKEFPTYLMFKWMNGRKGWGRRLRLDSAQ